MTALEVLTVIVRGYCLALFVLVVGLGARELWRAHLRGVNRVRRGAYRHAAPNRPRRWLGCSKACSESHTFRGRCERAFAGGRL